MTTSEFTEKEFDDMDSEDWVNFIDEMHCTDYWYPCDDYDPNDDPCCGWDEYGPDEDDEYGDNDQDCDHGFNDQDCERNPSD